MYALAATGCLCVILIISVVVGDSADVGVQLRSDPQRAASALRKSSAGRYSGIVDGEQRSALLEACDAVEGAPAIFLTYANFGGGDDAFCRFLESTAHNGIPIEVLNWSVADSRRLRAHVSAHHALECAAGTASTWASDPSSFTCWSVCGALTPVQSCSSPMLSIFFTWTNPLRFNALSSSYMSRF